MNNNWIEIPFKDVVKYQKGKKPKRLENTKFKGSIPYLDIKAFEKGEIRRYADVESSNIIDSSSVGVVWDGARSGWVTKGQSGAIGSTIAKLTPIEIDVDYLFWFLESNFHELNTNTKGTGIPHVNPEVIWNLKFPLAPLNEQKRIAQQLDAIFKKFNQNKTRLERIPQLLKDFRQTVLQAAVTGELTKEWREENKVNSKEYLEEILEDVKINFTNKCEEARLAGERKPKDQRKNKKSTKPVEKLPEIPLEWSYKRLEDVTYLVSDGVHHKPKYIEKGIEFLSVRNVRPFKINTSRCKYISLDDHENFTKRCKPEKGDILYTKVGATYGYASLVKSEKPFSIFVSLALIKPSRLLFPEYLEVLFNSELIFEQARQRISGTGVPDLHLIEIRDFRIPIPTFEEQKLIVTIVQNYQELFDSIEKKYEQAKIKIEHLPQAILAKAFRGELVEQDPNDEPASELLKKIEEAKKVLKKKSKK